jgi:Ca2+/Na+ antiporter
LGAAVGVGLFIVTVVLGVVCFSAEIKVTRRPFLRDVLFFFFATCFMFFTFLDNAVELWEGIVFIVIYIFYVLVVVFGRVFRQLWNKKFGGGPAIYGSIQEEQDEIIDDDWTGGWKEFPKFEREYNVEEISEKEPLFKSSQEETVTTDSGYPIILENHFSSEDLDEQLIVEEEINSKTEKPTVFENILHSFDWYDKPWYKKIHFVLIDGIWIVARNLTIFRAEKENWNKYYATAVPIFSPFLIIYSAMGKKTRVNFF